MRILLHSPKDMVAGLLAAAAVCAIVANALFLGVLAEFVMEAPISFLLTWYLGPNHRSISLSFGTNDAAWLFIAGTVLVIARVMAEARRVADENAAFV